MAAGHGVDLDRWQAHFDGLMGRIAGRFGRVEPRRHARDLVLGLMSDLPGKNCWTIAEHAGHASPGGLQHLLARAVWDADGVRDDLRGYVREHLGDADAVLVVDETGDLKKGTRTVAVQRQYTGTAGRIENAQVAVYLTYAARAGHALIDRALYLPSPGPTTRPVRRGGRPRRRGVRDQARAGPPDDHPGAGRRHGRPVGRRRRGLRRRPGPAPRAGGPRHRVRAGGRLQPPGRHRRRPPARRRHRRPPAPPRLAADIRRPGLQRPPLLRLGLDHHRPGAAPAGSGPCSSAATTAPASWRTTAATPPARCPWPPWSASRAAAGPWKRRFQAGKGLAGLGQHQVRRWTSWHRWTILAMLACAFLAVLAATERARQPPPDGMIPLTSSEIHHLLNVLAAQPAPGLQHQLRWSAWRRRHQHRARTSHYQKRARK